MFLCRLAYISRPDWQSPCPQARFDALKSILSAGRRNNPLNGITGVLIFDGRYFLQVLEGRRDTVFETFLRILPDKRHSQVTLAGFHEVPDRLFEDWAVLARRPDAGAVSAGAITDPDALTFEALVGYARRHREHMTHVEPISMPQDKLAAGAA